MNTIDYRNSMEKRLIAWKAKMNDLHVKRSQAVDLKKEKRFCATTKT